MRKLVVGAENDISPADSLGTRLMAVLSVGSPDYPVLSDERVRGKCDGHRNPKL